MLRCWCCWAAWKKSYVAMRDDPSDLLGAVLDDVVVAEFVAAEFAFAGETRGGEHVLLRLRDSTLLKFHLQ
jgi:hypothetical protein